VKQGYPTLSQLPAKLKGLCPLSALSVIGETIAFCNAKSQTSGKAKSFYNAKSQASGEAKAIYNAKSPTSGEVTVPSSARPSGEVSDLSGTKFIVFKAKLASCEAISFKAEASKTQATDRSVPSVALTKLLAKQVLMVALNSKPFIRLRTHLGM